MLNDAGEVLYWLEETSLRFFLHVAAKETEAAKEDRHAKVSQWVCLGFQTFHVSTCNGHGCNYGIS